VSAIVQTEIYCDDCGRSEFYRTSSKREARKLARDAGWLTNINPSPNRHAELDIRRDECPHCRRKSRKATGASA
jgi:hypothetical protein